MKQKRNFWPQSIILSIIAIIFACGYTIKIALDNPVQMDGSYMQPYQQVDENINDLLFEQKKFDARFQVRFDGDRLNVGTNSVALLITDTDGKEINNASIELLVTRPETTEFDQILKPSSIQSGKYFFENIDIQKIGRWQFVAKMQVDSLRGFYKTEYLATQ